MIFNFSWRGYFQTSFENDPKSVKRWKRIYYKNKLYYKIKNKVLGQRRTESPLRNDFYYKYFWGWELNSCYVFILSFFFLLMSLLFKMQIDSQRSFIREFDLQIFSTIITGSSQRQKSRIQFASPILEQHHKPLAIIWYLTEWVLFDSASEMKKLGLHDMW